MPRVGTITINSKQGKLQICSLPLIAKLITIFMVQLPLLAIDLLLALVGMKFLMYCNALGKLIVKAISLSFIETVSGVVFVTCLHCFVEIEITGMFYTSRAENWATCQKSKWVDMLIYVPMLQLAVGPWNFC